MRCFFMGRGRTPALPAFEAKAFMTPFPFTIVEPLVAGRFGLISSLSLLTPRFSASPGQVFDGGICGVIVAGLRIGVSRLIPDLKGVPTFPTGTWMDGFTGPGFVDPGLGTAEPGRCIGAVDPGR